MGAGSQMLAVLEAANRVVELYRSEAQLSRLHEAIEELGDALQAKLDDTLALDALDACSPCSLVIEESGEARVTLWRDGEPLAFIGDNVREALAALGGMEVRGE